MADPPVSSSASFYGHQYANLYAHNSNVLQGNVYIHGSPGSQGQEREEIVQYGLCLASAPVIDASYFVGRAAELERMKEVLHPGERPVEQRRLVLGGMGGIGKTQLVIAYARLHQASYTSVFWLNATTDLTLRESFRLIAQRLFQVEEPEKLDHKQIVLRTHKWLSDTRNRQWLLIFDNYDDPDQFAISDYIPDTAHGSVIITTRLPDLVRGQQIRVQPIGDVRESLEILQNRSQRSNVQNDPGARRLAERLAGLPLALATAGAYLRKTTVTFEQYLSAYEQCFDINPRRPVMLQEYQDRTLYTTWDLSYSRLERDDPLAANTLKLLAYFDNQEIWFGLLHAGLDGESPSWLRGMAAEHIDFENVMGTLVDSCLVEAQPTTRSYSIHSCVHDWVLVQLNKNASDQLYRYAVKCVVSNINTDGESLGQLHYARLARHGSRCAHNHFQHVSVANGVFLNHTKGISWIARLLAKQELPEAEQMYLRALAGKEKALGHDHTSTLRTVISLGNLYVDQGKLEQAEEMYTRALAGIQRAFGADHTSTLMIVNNFGVLYDKQGKLEEAEEMYMRALAGREKALGPHHTVTLRTVNNLGALYDKQGKLEQAEQMYMRALAGTQKALGADHTLTLTMVNNLAILYRQQGKLEQAEQMYMRALAGTQKALGADHTLTLTVVNNLGILYNKQGKLEQAEQMYIRALVGYEKVFGRQHPQTISIIRNLSLCYRQQGKTEAHSRSSQQVAVVSDKNIN